MTNEPAHTTLKKEWHQKYHKSNFVSESVFQQSILRNGKGGGYYALFSATLRPLHSVTNEEQYEKCICNQSSCYGKIANTATGKPHHSSAN